jgi:hypothetical protein
VAKLTRLTHKIAIQLHQVAESCIICISRSRQPVLKLLDTLLYAHQSGIFNNLSLLGFMKCNLIFKGQNHLSSEMLSTKGRFKFKTIYYYFYKISDFINA